MTWNELTETIREFEREQAHGSETPLWGLYCDRSREVVGTPAYNTDDERLGSELPDGEGDWWLKAYELQGRIENLADSIREEIFDGDWGVNLSTLEADITSSEKHREGKKMENNLAVWSDPKTGETRHDMEALEFAAIEAGLSTSERGRFLNWVFEGVTDDLTAEQALTAYKDEQETLRGFVTDENLLIDATTGRGYEGLV